MDDDDPGYGSAFVRFYKPAAPKKARKKNEPKTHYLDVKKSAAAGIGASVAKCGARRDRFFGVTRGNVKFVARGATCKRCNPR